MALWKTPEKTTLINKIDVKYREIENVEFQFQIMTKILEAFEIKDLKKILKATKKIKKVEIEEEKKEKNFGKYKELVRLKKDFKHY